MADISINHIRSFVNVLENVRIGTYIVTTKLSYTEIKYDL